MSHDHNEKYAMTREDQIMLLNAMHALFAGRYDEARNADPGFALFMDVVADAMVEGARKGEAVERFKAATEHDRAIVAGIYNMLEFMIGQMKTVLARVGAEMGDGHVEVISLGGCGDPDCPGCGGQAFDSAKLGEALGPAIKEKLAAMLGFDPAKVGVDVVSVDTLDAVQELLGKTGQPKLDKHTNEMMEALDSMPGAKRPRLKPKKLPS
jgi:hypothetical protein